MTHIDHFIRMVYMCQSSHAIHIHASIAACHVGYSTSNLSLRMIDAYSYHPNVRIMLIRYSIIISMLYARCQHPLHTQASCHISPLFNTSIINHIPQLHKYNSDNLRHLCDVLRAHVTIFVSVLFPPLLYSYHCSIHTTCTNLVRRMLPGIPLPPICT